MHNPSCLVAVYVHAIVSWRTIFVVCGVEYLLSEGHVIPVRICVI